jgi:hypothetical protein
MGKRRRKADIALITVTDVALFSIGVAVDVGAEARQGLTSLTFVGLAASAIAIVSALALIRLISQLNARQLERARALGDL